MNLYNSRATTVIVYIVTTNTYFYLGIRDVISCSDCNEFISDSVRYRVLPFHEKLRQDLSGIKVIYIIDVQTLWAPLHDFNLSFEDDLVFIYPHARCGKSHGKMSCGAINSKLSDISLYVWGSIIAINHSETRTNVHKHISKREGKLAEYLLRGDNIQQISHLMGASDKLIFQRRAKLFSKLGVGSVADFHKLRNIIPAMVS